MQYWEERVSISRLHYAEAFEMEGRTVLTILSLTALTIASRAKFVCKCGCYIARNSLCEALIKILFNVVRSQRTGLDKVLEYFDECGNAIFSLGSTEQ